MAVKWADGVNTKAYGMETSAKDNLIKVKFESGKERTMLANSRAKKQFSFLLTLDDSGDRSEYKLFWAWYDNVLLSGTNSFYFPDLITNKGLREYKMTKTPSASGQKHKRLSIFVEEC